LTHVPLWGDSFQTPRVLTPTCKVRFLGLLAVVVLTSFSNIIASVEQTCSNQCRIHISSHPGRRNFHAVPDASLTTLRKPAARISVRVLRSLGLNMPDDTAAKSPSCPRRICKVSRTHPALRWAPGADAAMVLKGSEACTDEAATDKECEGAHDELTSRRRACENIIVHIFWSQHVPALELPRSGSNPDRRHKPQGLYNTQKTNICNYIY
jgi:hypothetical protein